MSFFVGNKITAIDPSILKELDSHENLEEWLDFLNKYKAEYDIVIVGRDTIGRNAEERVASRLNNLGCKTDFLALCSGRNSWRGYIAIIKFGNHIYEKLGEIDHDKLLVMVGGYEVCSSVWNRTGRFVKPSTIIKGGIDYSANRRGLNITVFDKSGTFISAVNIDAHNEESVFTKATNEINNFISTCTNYTSRNFVDVKIPELNLWIPSKPWGETAIIFGSSQKRLQEFAAQYGFNLNAIDEGFALSTGNLRKNGDITYIFNGVGFSRNKNGERTFLVGEEDVALSGINVCELRHECGQFELLIADEHGIELSKDYFGLSKWFYYNENGIFAACTNYHMFILLLRKIGLKLELNEHSVNYLACTSWIVEHLYTPETFIKGVWYASVDKDIRYSFKDKKLSLHLTPFYNEQLDVKKFNETEYRYNLQKAKEELIENMTAIFKSSQFKHIVIDITDGLDTRTNLCVFNCLPENLKKKASAYTIKRANTHINPGINFECDSQSALGLSNYLDLPFWSMPSEVKILPIPRNTVSYRLGTIFIERADISYSETIYPDTLWLTGGNGESCIGSGCYGVMSFSDSQVWDNYYPQITDDKILKAHRAEVFALLQALPSSNLQNQLDLFYTHFRNPMHFNTKFHRHVNFMSIQSIWAYRAKKLMQAREGIPFYTCQHDLMQLIDEKVAAFPYLQDKQKKRFDIGRKFRVLNNEIPTMVPNYSESGFNASAAKRRTNYLPDKETYKTMLSEITSNVSSEKQWYANEKLFLFLLKNNLEFLPSLNSENKLLELLRLANKDNFPNVNTVNIFLHLYYINKIINS